MNKLYRVVFTDQSSGEDRTCHVVADSLTQIEDYFADVKKVEVVDYGVDILTEIKKTEGQP